MRTMLYAAYVFVQLTNSHVSQKFLLKYHDSLYYCLQSPLLKDFHELRSQIEAMGLFSPNAFFYVAVMVHILFFDFLGWWTMRTFGTGWLSFIVASCFLATAQVSDG